jgi:hypothetical protein
MSIPSRKETTTRRAHPAPADVRAVRAGTQRADNRRRRREDIIDEVLDQSFPASDPPSWVQGTAPVPH